MMALVSSDELAKDVTGAEALLERHQVCIFISDHLTNKYSNYTPHTHTHYIVFISVILCVYFRY